MKRLLFLAFIFSTAISYQSTAQSNLLITPMRVVFDGAKQNQELSLVNIGNDTATFIITLVQYNMQEDGTYCKIEKPDAMPMSAEPFLRIFPRKVTLAPGEPQVIMLQCKRRADMSAGEYHSHLNFKAEKIDNPVALKNPAKDSTPQLSIQLTPLYGLSIPVIVRQGEASVNATFSNLKLEGPADSQQNLSLTINRAGNISTYGDIIVDYVPALGKQIQVGKVRGIGVYTDINKRNVVIHLNNPTSSTFGKGKLRVRYITNDENKKPVTYAVGELDV